MTLFATPGRPRYLRAIPAAVLMGTAMFWSVGAQAVLPGVGAALSGAVTALQLGVQFGRRGGPRHRRYDYRSALGLGESRRGSHG